MKKRLRGSHTIEMAILMPVILLVIFLPIRMGLSLRSEIPPRICNIWQEDYSVTKAFYIKELLIKK